MVTAGIDVGAKNVKALLFKDGKVLALAMTMTGLEEKKSIAQAFEDALKKAGISKGQVDKVAATGMGAKLVDFANKTIGINIANARGITFLFPSARTVI